MPKPYSFENNAFLLPLRQSYQEKFITLLQTVQGSTDDMINLIMDQSLSSVVYHIFMEEKETLSQHGLAEVNELSVNTTNDQCRCILYLISPCLETVVTAAKSMQYIRKSYKHNAPNFRFHVCFCPSINAVAEQVFTKLEVREFIECIHTFRLGFVPIDRDLMVIPGCENSLSECYAEGNSSSLKHIALAVDSIEQQLGSIEEIKLKGNLSKAVWKSVSKLREEKTSSITGSHNLKEDLQNPIGTLILLDRKVDYASVLSTSLTYESLLDEILGIENGFLKVDASSIGEYHEASQSPPGTTDTIGETPSSQENQLSISLNADDEVFNEIRDQRIEVVGAKINAKAVAVREKYTNFRKTSDEATISEIHDFVRAVPALKLCLHSLERHVHLIERVKHLTDSKEFRTQWNEEQLIMIGGYDIVHSITERVYRHEPLINVLRLMCLYSVVEGGIIESNLVKLKKDVLQTYGYGVELTLNQLEVLGLLKGKYSETKGTFFTLRDELKLLEEEADASSSNIGYATGGYAPLSVRLVEEALKPSGWKGIKNILHQIQGPTVEITPKVIHGQDKHSGEHILVCFVGGVTYLEIATMRLLSKKYKREILIAATGIVNGGSFIKKLCVTIENGLVKNKRK